MIRMKHLVLKVKRAYVGFASTIFRKMLNVIYGAKYTNSDE